MITVDISNIWSKLSLPDLLGCERTLFDAHQQLEDGTGVGKEWTGWLSLPERMQTEESRIMEAADQIRAQSDILVVAGIGGSSLGAKAAVSLLNGEYYNLTKRPQIFFAGNTLSTASWKELVQLLEGKEFSVNLISRSGSTLETAIAARNLLWLMERRYGKENMKERIYVTTGPNSSLRCEAEDEGWALFDIPESVGGRYSVLSAVGLLPMAVAGIDIHAVLAGASQARENYNIRSFENPVWLYAASRQLLREHGMEIELLGSWEPAFSDFGKWWQQLFAESEGKNGKGIFPVPLNFSADLHSVGQLIQDGKRNLFESMIHFAPLKKKVEIEQVWKDYDGLNYLAGRTIDYVQGNTYRGVVQAHTDDGVPMVDIDAGPLNADTVGTLFYFFELSCALSARLEGVNPFDQPGVERYKKETRSFLRQSL